MPTCPHCLDRYENCGPGHRPIPSTRDHYLAALPTMPAEALLADLESCIRQDSYGSHTDQLSLVRGEILRRIAQGTNNTEEN